MKFAIAALLSFASADTIKVIDNIKFNQDGLIDAVNYGARSEHELI